MKFIDKIAPLYVEHARGTDTMFVSVLIAQSCVESGYGTSELALKANNFGGIKAKPEWDGSVYIKSSLEYISGEYVMVQSKFAKFNSMEDYVDYHVKFFTRNSYAKDTYNEALNAKTVEDQAKALTGTYASDPKYYEKLIDIINQYDLRKYDKGEMSMRPFIKDHTNVNMGGKLNAVKYLVFHFVGASGQAKANANYFKDVYRGASAHLFIDPNETREVVPLDRVAWHIGDGANSRAGSKNGYVHLGGATNHNSIGVELCQDVTTGKDVWNWDFNPKTRQEAILVFAYLMKKFNVPIDNVIRHFDASGKACPGNWAHNDWLKWKLWKEDLRTYVNTGKLINSQKGESIKPQSKPIVNIQKYKAPTKPFDTLKVGQTVTIRQGHSYWFNPQDPSKGIVPSKNFALTKDKIKAVRDAKIGYSTKAYLLEGYNSWILEQDLVEARQSWSKTQPKLIEDNELVLDGVKYKVVKEI